MLVQSGGGVRLLTTLAQQMRRLSSTTLCFDDVKGATTKDLELGTFNVVDKCVLRVTQCQW